MKWNETTEPLGGGIEELRRALEEYDRATTALSDGLHESAAAESTMNWRPHLPQMHAALVTFAELCRDELDNVGLWREDGLEPNEVHDLVWDEGERLVQWLNRMMGTS